MRKIYAMKEGGNLFFFHDERPFGLTEGEMEQIRSELQNMKTAIK